MNAGIHQGYIKHLHRRQKETCITLCYVDIFSEWSDYKNICDINTKQTKKSHRPHHCQEIAIIIHHHPRHHHFDHHHYKHFCLHIYIYISMNAARKSMFVTWMQIALISMALITALVRMDYYWNFQLFKVQRIGWSLHKNILLFLAQLQF